MNIHVVAVNVGDHFEPAYVELLQAGFRQHLSLKHDFTVITDNPSLYPGMRSVESTQDAPPSWWHKFQIFRDDIWPEGETVFYVDLDSVVIGSLDKLAERKGFNMIGWNGKWYPYGSGVMVFPAGRAPELSTFDYRDSFLYDKGDQQRIAEYFQEQIQPIRSNEVSSYKRDGWSLTGNEPGEGFEHLTPRTERSSIIAFHGTPRPHQLADGHWIKKKWKDSHFPCAKNRGR